MSNSTVRISASAHSLLKELASDEKVSLQELLDRALDAYRRKRFLEQVNAGYAELLGEPDAAADLAAERALWDGTLGDGLPADGPWEEPAAAKPVRKAQPAKGRPVKGRRSAR